MFFGKCPRYHGLTKTNKLSPKAELDCTCLPICDTPKIVKCINFCDFLNVTHDKQNPEHAKRNPEQNRVTVEVSAGVQRGLWSLKIVGENQTFLIFLVRSGGHPDGE